MIFLPSWKHGKQITAFLVLCKNNIFARILYTRGVQPFAIASCITFIYMKYGHQWARVIFIRYCQVPTNTEHIQTQIAYSFYNSLWHHHPDCYASWRLIFLPCVCLATIFASTVSKSYILNYMWTAANFIIEGRTRSYDRRLCTVALHITKMFPISHSTTHPRVIDFVF